MSYSISTQVAYGSWRSDLDKAIADQGYADPPSHVEDHLVVAVDVVSRMVDAVGPKSAPLQVTIGGHANEGHVSAEGFGEESMSVWVAVLRPEPAAEGGQDATLDDT